MVFLFFFFSINTDYVFTNFAVYVLFKFFLIDRIFSDVINVFLLWEWVMIVGYWSGYYDLWLLKIWTTMIITINVFVMFQNQVGLPWYITALMYFTVNVLPYTQSVGSITMMIAGLAMIGKSVFDAVFGYKKPLYSYSSLDLLPSIS